MDADFQNMQPGHGQAVHECIDSSFSLVLIRVDSRLKWIVTAKPER
jgi:hypothetical protein